MTRKIFCSILTAVASVLLLSFFVITGVLYSHFAGVQKAQLKAELGLAVQGVEMNGASYLAGLSQEDYRITWVAADGTVLVDTQVTREDMDNHLDREEIKEALENGEGESSRYSYTLTETTLYSTRRLSDGSVLRISTSLDSVFALLADILVPMMGIFLLAIVISILLARRMAKRIVDPLNALDLDHPAENDAYEELSPILGKINKQHRQIARQMELLRQKTQEFEQITSCMNEGLVLLDENGVVLSMNPAAQRLYSVDDNSLNQDFLTIDRSMEMSRGIKSALAGKRSEFRVQKNGGEYQFGISPIESDGQILGAVILAFDVTEAAFSERNRQEFTANVSHELKTPLQSIIGSAELLENGLVKTEDIPRFVGHIKNQAARLVTLINDIIRLSQLDENGGPVGEPVDLYEVAAEVLEGLADPAAKKGVEMSLSGSSCVLNGVRRYLYEVIYNLCDNAIRYNVEGGKVAVSIGKDKETIVLTVSDTGIGIAPEHHSRVFERFYRVDKSRSNETEGTGLGLSIVKHAVQRHEGRMELDSTPGKGTTVRVLF